MYVEKVCRLNISFEDKKHGSLVRMMIAHGCCNESANYMISRLREGFATSAACTIL